MKKREREKKNTYCEDFENRKRQNCVLVKTMNVKDRERKEDRGRNEEREK